MPQATSPNTGAMSRTVRLVTSGRLHLYAVSGVIASFLATMAFAQFQSRSIDRNAAELTHRTMPSLQRLVAMNVALRHYTFDALDYAFATPAERPSVADKVQASRRELVGAFAAYRSMGRLSLERSIEASLDGQMASLAGAVTALMAARGGVPAADLLTLRERANAVGYSIARLIDLGSQRGELIGEQVTSARQRALAAELVLGGLSVLIALLAALLTLALTRQSAAFFEAQTEELRRKADELERFSSRVAHDVLSPLNNVGLALQIASVRAAPDERLRPALARGMASLGRVQRLVDGLLDFALAGARPSPGVRASVEDGVTGVVEATADEARRLGIDVRVEPLPSPCPEAACHEGVLASLLGNLVRNALKYMGDSSRRTVTLRVRTIDDRLHFEVEDSGPGIPEELAERIFEPYVRGPETGQPGLGLGLATVQRLVEAHGGTVGVRPGREGGSCFWFELPAAEPLRPRPRPPEAPSLSG